MLPYAEVVGCAAGEDCANVRNAEVATAESVHVTFELAFRAVERRCDLGSKRRDSSRRVGTVEDDDALGASEGGPDLIHRQGTERRDAQEADGLALGKGVLICANQAEAEKAVDEIMVDKAFGAAGAIAASGFDYPVKNYYMTDPISRASRTMAQCTEEFVLAGTKQKPSELKSGTHG